MASPGSPAPMNLNDPMAVRGEKQRVALLSVLAAVGLTLAKLIIGLATGSLGLLADALNSGVDLVASLATLFAVRIADKPPDHDHPYGHARVENLAALGQAALLLGTAAWLVVEAVQRLLGEAPHVQLSVWAFLVMLGSIVVDLTRSRALRRAAEKHHSEALAADALHFETDIWSSLIVIAGLVGVWIGQQTGQLTWWGRADAGAALLVGLLVVYLAGRLARNTIDALTDRAPEDLVHRIAEAAARVPEVIECRRVRLRRSGPLYFADVVVTVPRTTTFAQSHDVSEAIEDAVRAEAPRTDVVVHVEPAPAREESAVDQVHFLARQLGVRAHDVRVRSVDGALEADLHLEVAPDLSLERAHELATRLEERIVDENPDVRMVSTHLEAPERVVEPRREVTAERRWLVERIRQIAEAVPGVDDCHEVHVYQTGAPDSPTDLVLHCSFPPHLSVAEVHERSAEIERELRRDLGPLGSILVHAEPR